MEVDDNDHERVIIHIDLDCFYAQVEMNKRPHLRHLPLGIQQKSFVVTSNYIARKFGVGKCIPVSEAKELCPDLILVNGEDLYDYRQISYKVTSLLQKFSSTVERLGLDENFIDVTDLALKRASSTASLDGEVFGDVSTKCECGCYDRLVIGTNIAKEIRQLIKTELNLTSCAGIAHNKLLAKIAGSMHKPDQQTVVFPNSSLELMLNLKLPKNIPGIGRAMAEQLSALGVHTIKELHSFSKKRLEEVMGMDKAKHIVNLSYGIDKTPVKNSGKPSSIGLEDSCKSISVEEEVRDKLGQLLRRLFILVGEDGRIPKTLKLTVRKFDKDLKVSHRETKQCNIIPTLFSKPDRETKILNMTMNLFNRAVDVNKPYHITLLGLAFTKFVEPPRNSITSYLQKNIEVHSVTSIENHEERTVDTSASITDTSTSSLPECSSPSVSPQPSPKKLKLGVVMTKRRCFDNFDDCASPSKLRVADLCLSSDKDVFCPPDADEDVFRELPRDVQKELWDDYKRHRERACGSQVKKTKTSNTLLNYFIRNN